MAKREGSTKDSATRNNQASELVPSEAPSELLRELVAHLRQNRTQLARGMGGAHHRDPPAHRDDQGRDLRGSDFGVRQLRGGSGNRSLRSAASLRAQPVGTHHSARRRDARSRGNRSSAARRAGPLPVREVPDRFQEIEPHSGCVRACREPHREHRGRRFRARARARHPPATGSDPGTLDAGAAGARTIADSADHRRDRSAARPPVDGAAPARNPHQPRESRGDRYHRCGGHGRDGCEPPGANGGSIAAAWRDGHCHGAFARDCADAW